MIAATSSGSRPTSLVYATRSLFFAEGNVKRFKTLVVMDRAKVGTAIPIAAREPG